MKLTIFGYLCRDRNVLLNGEVSEIVGGKGLFTGGALSRSGVDTTLITWLPESDRELLSALQPYGIKSFVIPMPTGTVNTNTHEGDVTIATTKIDPKSIGISDLTEEIRQAIVQSDVILLMPDLESKISIEVIRYLSRDLGVTIAADVGKYFRDLRPDGTLVPRYPWPRQAEFLSNFTTVFLSVEDVAAAFDRGESILSLARTMADQGPSEVIITEGSKGAWVYSHAINDLVHIPAYPPHKLVDPTGVGDTFAGAYLAEHLRSDDIHTAGRFAAMAASLTLNYSGPLRETAQEVQAKLKEADTA